MAEKNTRTPLMDAVHSLNSYKGVMTPWNKLISQYEAYQYALRHNASIASAFMQVLRIMIPDYTTRSDALCDINKDIYKAIYSDPVFQEQFRDRNCVPPFVSGPMIGVLQGDQGDESLWMAGRVNDYGTYRFEKELDSCPWDIVGSEYCRCTTCFFQAQGEAFGPNMEFNMIEAKGCGDLHCRVVGEDRIKYPMPPRKHSSDTLGPIATMDEVKYTPEEKCYKDPQFYRPECNGIYRNGFCAEWTTDEQYSFATPMPLGSNNIIPVLYAMCDMETTERVTKCIFEAAGKMAFSEFAAIKGIRDWLGVPGDVNDGRVLGALIEVVLQSTLINYQVVQFDEEAAIYDINLAGIQREMPLLTTAYMSLWFGMCKTLVGTMWAAWRETENVPEGVLRFKIAKKIDKYC